MPGSAPQSIASTEAFREIVQQVRSGQKSNAEMFDALRELARRGVEHPGQRLAQTPQQARAHEAPEGSSDSNLYANSVQLAKFSPEDRKKLLLKVVAQRRSQQRRRNQSWMPGSAGKGIDVEHPRIAAAVQDIYSQSDTLEQDEQVEQEFVDADASVTYDSSDAEERKGGQRHRRQLTDEDMYADERVDEDSADGSAEETIEEGDRAQLSARGPSVMLTQSQRVGANGQPRFSDDWDEHVDELVDEQEVQIRRTASMYMMGSQRFRESQTDAMDEESGMRRSRRFSRSLLDIKQEAMKEYTFKPSIKKLPSYYGPKKEEGQAFYDRVMRWSQTREMEVEQQRDKAARNEVAGCTFAPKLNENSKRAVQAIRTDTDLSASERLYKQIAVIQQNKQRREHEHDKKKREAEEKACTFQPRLVSSPKHRQSHEPNFAERSRSWAERSTTRHFDTPEYPFHPKINGIKENMTAARLYTGTPVVERLTRSYAADDSFVDDATLDRPSMDAKSFLGSIQGNRPRPAPHSRAASRELTPAEQQQRQKAFQMFLARQNNTLVRKESKVKALAQKQQTNFQPRLCQKSLDITDEQNKGTFLDRLERDRLKREHESQRKEILSQAVSHSFKPELTKKSSSMRSRSAHEMSRGDLMKRETNQRLLRLRMEQAQLSEMTFKPRISTVGQANNGKLRLTASTEQYLATIKAMQQRKHEKQIRVKQEREANELEDCTFTPATIDCPTYIQRISQSMKIAKAMRSTDEAPARPDWR